MSITTSSHARVFGTVKNWIKRSRSRKKKLKQFQCCSQKPVRHLCYASLNIIKKKNENFCCPQHIIRIASKKQFNNATHFRKYDDEADVWATHKHGNIFYYWINFNLTNNCEIHSFMLVKRYWAIIFTNCFHHHLFTPFETIAINFGQNQSISIWICVLNMIHPS